MAEVPACGFTMADVAVGHRSGTISTGLGTAGASAQEAEVSGTHAVEVPAMKGEALKWRAAADRTRERSDTGRLEADDQAMGM
jgi:hypothetical protein